MWRWLKRSKPQTELRPSPTIWISARLLDRTVEILRESGDEQEAHEGVAYWAGHRVAQESFITTCIAPSAQTTYGSFGTSSRSNARVVIYLASAGLELIGQVHSHPGTFVDHSKGDDRRALMPYEGFLSVVVPEYGRIGMHPLTICGVHIFERSSFRRISDSDIETLFHVVDDFVDLRK